MVHSFGRRALACLVGLVLVVSGQSLWLTPAAQAAAPPPADNPSGGVTADVLPTAQVNGVVWDQAVVGNTVYVVGEFTSARPAGSPLGTNESPRSNLMAYDLTTGEMTAWAPKANGRVRTVAASPDGSRLYIGGSFTAIDGAGRWRVAAFRTADGSLDPSFAPVIGSDVFAIAPTASHVYLGGWFTAVNSVPRTRLAAVAASNGALLDWAPTADNTVHGLALTGAQDRVVIAGSFTTLNGAANRSIGSVDAATGASYPFAAASVINNTGSNAALMSLKVVGNQVFTTGFSYGTGNVEGVVVADAYTGRIDNMLDCHGDTYDAVPMNGVVYSVSHHHMCSNSGGFPEISPRRFYHADGFTLAATGTVNKNTQTDPQYANWEGQPTGAMVHWYNQWTPGSFTDAVQAGWTAEATDDYLLIGGEFLAINGIQQQGLVRFGTRNVVPDPSVGPAGLRAESAPVLQSVVGEIRGTFLANYDRDSSTLTYKVVRSDKGEANPVAQLTAESTPWNRPTLSFSDPDVIPGWTYQYHVVATDPDGNAKASDTTTVTTSTTVDSYATAVVKDGAQHYWRLGQATGQTQAPDFAGSRPLTLLSGARAGAAGVLAGQADTATSFDGSTRGTAGTTGSAEPGPHEFSVEAWFKTTSMSGGKIVGFSNSSTGQGSSYDRQIYLNGSGRVTFGVYPNGTVRTVTSASGYRDGQWHHVVGTVSPSGMRLYVDGTLVGTNTSGTSAQVMDGYWRVGGDRLSGWPNSGSSGYLNGTVDEVAIYPTALSAQQIAAHRSAAITPSTNDVPTASYLTTSDGLAAQFDASASADTDGSIVSYGWEFGDGGRATGRTATHEYGAPGTYSVKLTVVDDHGDIGTLTQAVTVEVDGEHSVFAKDTFNRAGLRWGTAAVGGPWTDSGSAYYSTNGSHGLVTLPRAGVGPVATLAQVDAQDVTLRTDITLDKVPTGGPYLHQVSTRVNGSANYKLTARFETSGAVRMILARTVGTTETTLRTVTVPGVTLTAGQRLNLRLDVQGTPTTTLEAKLWKEGEAEPTAPQVKVTDATPELQRAGAVRIASYTSGAMTSLPLVVSVDDLQVDEFVDTNTPPTASFTAAPAGLDVAVDATGSTDADGTITSYAWEFGDGTTASGATARHTYAEAGTYPVTLAVTDDDGATSRFAAEVSVVKPNVAPQAVMAAPEVQGLSVTLDGSASVDPDGDIATHVWDFGDGEQTEGALVAHTYAAAGTYTVELTVTDDRGALTSVTREVTVGAPPAVNTPPVASFTAAATALTVALDGSASADADGSVASHTWDFGDGTTGTGDTASHTYAAAGTYPVTLTVTDDRGATGTATRTIAVTGPAQPPADPGAVAQDTFSRTGAGWGTAEVGGAWSVNVASSFTTDGAAGRISLPAGATRSAQLNAVSAKDVSIATDLTLQSAPQGGSYYHQVLARLVGTTNYTLTLRTQTNGALVVYISKRVNGVETTLRSTTLSGFNYASGERLNVTFDLVGTDLRASVWRAGGTQPTTPTVQVTDATAELAAPGAVGLKAYASGGITNAPVLVGVDGFTVRAAPTGGAPEDPPVEPTPVNTAPVASFRADVAALGVTVDGRGSSDADGSVASHAWTFGDGGEASGATATHTYAAAGTYPVTLTVTDDRGATATSTQQVTVTAPAPADPDPTDPAALARDTFTRTGSGWGVSEVGGTWTVNQAASFATDGSTGTVIVPAGGTRMARLLDVSASDVVVATDLTLSAAPVGGTYYHQLLARVSGTNQYVLTTRLETSGALRVQISRVVGGAETVVKSTLVSGFNYTDGERLNLRFVVKGTSLEGTVWRVTDPQPTTPTVAATDATAELQAPGAVGVRAYAGSPVTNGPLTVRIDAFEVMTPA